MFSWISNASNVVYLQIRRLRKSMMQPISRFSSTDPAVSFQEVRAKELLEINASRGLRNRPAISDDLVGLAFSGGGIRSATFNLGILQGLAKMQYLRQIDYISTVSGGGYIGAWLVAWIRRVGSECVQQRLSENRQPAPPHEAWRYLEPDQIRFLRKYSNYLTPRAGLLSTDTWAAVAVYLRNLILNLVVLMFSGTCVLLLPDFVLWGLKARIYPPAVWLLILVGAALVLVMLVVGIGFGALSTQSPARLDWRRHIVNHAGVWTSLPLFAAATSTVVLLGFYGLHLSGDWRPWILNGGWLYFALWLISTGARWWSRGGEEPQPVEQEMLFQALFPIAITLVVGSLQGYTVYWIWRLFHLVNTNLLSGELDGGIVALVVFGPVLLVGTALLTAVLHMGLAGRALPDANREWLARASAVSSLVALGWIIVTSATFYGPLFMKWLTASQWAQAEWGKLFKWVVFAAWGAITAGGIAAGRSSATSGKGNDRFNLITGVAPPVFAAGLVLLLSFGLDAFLSRLPSLPPHSIAVSESPQQLLERIRNATQAMLSASGVQQAVSTLDNLRQAASPVGGARVHDLAQEHWSHLSGYLGNYLLWVMVSSLLVAWILGDRVDVNEFSMHLFYRNRLTRAYLGASQFSRQSEPFTGFSPEDDMPLCDLLTTVGQKRLPLDTQPAAPLLATGFYDGPYPIFDAALNLVRGKELAWQSRKAASFVYTPLFCGYDYFANEPASATSNFSSSGYRPTSDFGRPGGLHLGTPVAVSGAAASPNMGYHTSPGLAFLMTVFNVRLGWWAGNPRHRTTWRRLGPAYGLLYLIREIFPSTNDEMRYIYLSDGGHFENLGIYELIRRKCQFIIACDADCDPDASFDNLGNAVEKCRRDFGTEITIKIDELKHSQRNKKSTSCFAMGTISYRNQAEPAWLLYIKPSLTGREPEDVQSYAAKHSAFPHDTTANQFFDESQFESYRALGEHIFKTILDSLTAPVIVGGPAVSPPTSLRELFTALRTYFQQHPVGP
jgi:predicted acylesterase/phospholipase RssA